MKPLFEHLKQNNYILEAFSGEIVRTRIFPSFRHSYMRNAFKWDKITDDDLQQVDVNEALTLARKRNEENVIIWLYQSSLANLQDRVVAVTKSIYPMYVSEGSVGFAFGRTQRPPSMPKIAAESNTAYLLKNAEKFSTTELKHQRIKARENALAFKSNAQIAEENMLRYQALAVEMKAGSETDIKGWVDAATEAYKECAAATLPRLQETAANMIFADNFKEFYHSIDETRMLWRKLNDSYNEIINNVMRWKEAKLEATPYDKDAMNFKYNANIAKKAFDDIKTLCDRIKEYVAELPTVE